MMMIVFGTVMAFIGLANLKTSQMHPERINSGIQRGLGYVGITCGVISILCGLLVLIVPAP
jgi:hypothetical protein